jgi:polyferredoxin
MQFGLPDVDHLSQLISQATAPAFLLGAVAGFISILMTRMTGILDRIRSLNEIGEDDAARIKLKSDIPRLMRRARLINSAIYLALGSGMCATLLLVLGFVSAFVGIRHEYGAGLLFLFAVSLLGVSLFRFAQEVSIGLSEFDHYR